MLKPFYHNRVSEIRENMGEMRLYCPVEDIYHVSGDLNPADMATRGSTSIADLGPNSPLVAWAILSSHGEGLMACV